MPDVVETIVADLEPLGIDAVVEVEEDCGSIHQI